MRTSTGCVAALLTLVQFLLVDAAGNHRHEFDFRVANLQRNGMPRTVVNGQLSPLTFSHQPKNSCTRHTGQYPGETTTVNQRQLP